jgi:hypothetical protein
VGTIGQVASNHLHFLLSYVEVIKLQATAILSMVTVPFFVWRLMNEIHWIPWRVTSFGTVTQYGNDGQKVIELRDKIGH